MGKGDIARYEQFLIFPQCFQKACIPGVSKGVIVWEWVKGKGENKPAFSTFCTSLYPSRKFNLYLICQIWALPIQQQLKIRHGDTIIWFVMSNFSFSHNDFKNCLTLMHQNKYLWSKGLTFSKTTDSSLIQTERAWDDNFESDENGVKGPWEGRKHCLLEAIIPFPTEFSNYILQTHLTHSHTMTPFDAPGKLAFWKHCGNRRNCL